MKAIYFPFTTISDERMTVIGNCFDSPLVVYQPTTYIPKTMQQWIDKGRVEIRRPVQGDEELLEKIVREYQKWAELHQGAELSAFRFIVDDEESSIARIRKSLRTYDIPKDSEKSDPMFNVRLFLRIAQEYDLQHQEADKEISAFEKMEKAMMEELRGEEDELGIPSDKIIIREDAGEYMTAERMMAWTQLMLRDTEESCLFITESPAILEYLQDKAASEMTEEIGDVKIPKTCLEHISFYRIAENPRALFAR
jgi:hypothetical protein